MASAINLVVGANPTRNPSTWPNLNGSFTKYFLTSHHSENPISRVTVTTTMEASSSSLCRVPSLWTVGSRPRQMNFVPPGRSRGTHGLVVSNRRLRTPSALGEVAESVVEMGKSEITWQIIVGTIAGITPFVVAGVEFSKRIIAQKRCEECGGTGLVFKDKKYFRCPECGGFLPWQSWRRFFTG